MDNTVQPGTSGRQSRITGYLIAGLAMLGLLALKAYALQVLPGAYFRVPDVLVIGFIVYLYGSGPGVLAFMLSIFGHFYLYILPSFTFNVVGARPQDWAQLGVLVVGDVAAAVVMGKLREAQQQVASRALQLEAEIIERKQTDEALRKSETRFRALVTASSDVVYRMSPDWSEMCRLYGRGIIADTDNPDPDWLQRYISPEDQPYVIAAINEAVKTKSVFELEHRVIRLDGSLAWASNRAIPVLDANDEIVEWFGAASDVTERKRAEEAAKSARDELAQALDREQSFSLLLQRALLPSEPHIGSGYDVAAEYVPAFASREIGGDFYDVFRVRDSRAGVLMGDVSGRGLEAASMAATTRSTIHAFVHEAASAAEALDRANVVLCAGQADFGSFATVFLAIIDLDTGDITYSSAGHPPGLICRTDGAVEVLQCGQMPLAVFDGGRFEEHLTRFEPGDKLVFHTDGISEARHDSTFLDVEGIERTLVAHAYLHASELAHALLDAATNWANGRLLDDAAIVVVERVS